MGRIPCCEKDAVKRGQWTPEEDAKLVSYISHNGTRNWRLIPKKAGLQRCGKSCRLRWTNYLRPDLKHGEFTAEEEHSIVKLHSVVGNRWSLIAAQLPGRTDNDVKNHWNTKLKKKLSGMGIDPVTHKPFSHLMAEIASTLAPPQVAHLAEAALGCFKDEMLHLLTKKRIDWQLEKTTVSNGNQPPNRIWDHPPSNSFCHENRAKDKRSVEAELSKVLESNIFSNEPPSLSSRPWDSVQINAEVKDLSNCNGVNSMYSSFLQPPGVTHRYPSAFFAGGGTTGKYEVGPSTWAIEYPGHAENLDRTSFLTSSPPLKSSPEKRQQGVESGGSSMALWKLPVECNEDEEGSPWSQSVCSGSTCTGGDRHAFPPPQIKEEDDEEEEEEEAASDGGRGGVKGVEAFNSDCVLWDLSDDLMDPIM